MNNFIFDKEKGRVHARRITANDLNQRLKRLRCMILFDGWVRAGFFDTLEFTITTTINIHWYTYTFWKHTWLIATQYIIILLFMTIHASVENYLNLQNLTLQYYYRMEWRIRTRYNKYILRFSKYLKRM